MNDRTSKKYSPDSSTTHIMRRSQHEIQPSDTVRYVRRKDEMDRPAPPPYAGQVIPRVKPIQKFQKTSGNNSVGENSRPTSRRFDTFGENALETIYDQFKFLDESDEIPSAANTPTSVNSSRPIMNDGMVKKHRTTVRRPTMIMYCILPLLELLAAIAILATTFFTDKKFWETRPSEDPSEINEAVKTVSMQNALSTVIPSILQIITSIFGFWPIFPSKVRKSAQILHILIGSILIVLWFNSIFDLFFKILISHILGPINDEKYVIELIIGSLIYFSTIFILAITLTVSIYNFGEFRRKIEKSMMAISISLGVSLFSIATLVVGIFTIQGNLKILTENSTMLAYGLKESIVFIFVVVTAIFSLIISTQHNSQLTISAIIGQGICIMSITGGLFTSDRISAVFNELKSFETEGSATEIGIVLLNGCAAVSLLLLLLQLIVFTICVSPIHSLSHSDSAHSSLLRLDNNRNHQQRVERTAF